jgi:hypothetical protein
MTDLHQQLKPEEYAIGAYTQASKEEIIQIYEDLLKTIWEQTLPTIGMVTLIAIVERALVLTKENYPTIGYLKATTEGISFEILRQKLREEELLLLKEACKELILNLIDILGVLTGDILVGQLLQQIESINSL